MRPENQRMQDFLKQNGIKATPKFLPVGSMKGCWRLYGKNKPGKELENYQTWTPELQAKLTNLGFVDYSNEPLSKYSGNGGLFSVFVRGHNELL